jgi:hypothetical protein
MPFTSVLVLSLIALSWLTIYLLEKRNILRSWLTPVNQRAKEFMVGFLLIGFLCLVSQFVLSSISNTGWTLSDEITLNRFLTASFYDVNSVLFEELLFRGILLYGLIKVSTQQAGMILSAILFGVYHWYSYGVIGNMTGMILVLLTTGFMGYVFALACTKTGSIVFPIGLHLGWNWINSTFFSNEPNGAVVLVPDQSVAMEGFFALFSFLWYLLIPFIVLLFIKMRFFYPLRSPSDIIQHS